MPSHVFPFLQLPTEIRLLIYRFVLPSSTYHEDSVCGPHVAPVKWRRGKCHSMLSVNRQTHREATDLLYRENYFSIFVRHPREARLPLNEIRADDESFVLISWDDRTWSNPKNPKIPLPVLLKHQNLQDIRRLHISLPPFADHLCGVDMFMKKTSYAAFNGIHAWIRRCLREGGRIDDQERERMEYIQQIKEPIDQIGDLLQRLPRLDQLFLSFQPPVLTTHDISFGEYLLQGILRKRGVTHAQCSYVSMPKATPMEEFDYFASLLQGTPGTNVLEDSHLPPDLDGMYFLLSAIRQKHERDPSSILPWVNPMLR